MIPAVQHGNDPRDKPRIGETLLLLSLLLLPGGTLNIKMSSYQYRDPHVKDYLQRMGDYKNPLHLDEVDRYPRRMGDKTIPDEAPPSLESFYPPWIAGIDLPQSRCCGFFVSFTKKHK